MSRTDNIACPQSFKKCAHRNHWFGGNNIYVCISAFLHLWITDHKRRIYVAPSKYRSLWFRRPINVVKLQVKWPPIVVICQSVVPSRTSPGGDSSWPSLTWHGVVSLANVSQSSGPIPFVFFVPLEMLGYLRSYYIQTFKHSHMSSFKVDNYLITLIISCISVKKIQNESTRYWYFSSNVTSGFKN